MTRSKPHVFLASLALATLGAGAATAYLVDTGSIVPPQYDTLLPPAKGGSYTDPAFGTVSKRISDAVNTADAAAGSGTLAFVTAEYSTMSPFNSDGTRLLLQHQSYYALYDGAGGYLRDLPFEIHAGTEPRWARSTRDLLYYVSGNKLKSWNAATGAIATVRTFSEYGSIRGNGESDVCFDGDHMVFAGDGRYVFVYEISSGTKSPVFDTQGRGFDSLYITPDDNVTITWLAAGSGRYNGIELFDRNMNFKRQVTRAGGHMDVTRDIDGSEVLVWANAADPFPVCDNGLVKVRLADGQQTCLVTFPWGVALHVSGPDQGGWAFVETYDPSDPNPVTSSWAPYVNEVFQVRLDGSQVRRLAHHRSRPWDTYYYTPRVASNRQGTRLVYSSNFGLQSKLGGYPTQYVDVYLMDVPTAPPPTPTPTPSPTPSPGPSPSPTPSPTPAPTPPLSELPRYEQNASQVALTGTWSPNTLSLHSGGNAVLAMEAGARATFTFEGVGARWIGYRDEWSGIARVFVDGVDKGTVDSYASPGQAQAVLYSVGGLTAGTHTLTVEVTGSRSSGSGGSWVWVDAFDVEPAPAPAPTPTPSPSPTPDPGLVRYEQDAAEVGATGSWSPNGLSLHSGGSAVLSMTASSRKTITFHGTRVDWIGYRDEWSGIARVYLDGVDQGPVDTYASPARAQAVLFSLRDLAPGTHTLTVEATGTHHPSSGGGWVWVDAFDVEPAPLVPVRLEEHASAVALTGSWSPNTLGLHSDGRAVLSMTKGSRATVGFDGTGIEWLAYRDQWSGRARVFIDGKRVGTIDTYAKTGTPQSAVYSVSGLPRGRHTLVVEVLGTKRKASSGTWVWIDAFDAVP